MKTKIKVGETASGSQSEGDFERNFLSFFAFPKRISAVACSVGGEKEA